MTATLLGDDGNHRCPWPGSDALYLRYHDEEWGRRVSDDTGLFERIVLEGFQAGLSWLTILRKREAFRSAFAGFDPRVMARFEEEDTARLLNDAGIVRNRAKITAAVGNARRALDLMEAEGSIARFLAAYAPAPGPAPRDLSQVPTASAESKALSSELRRLGWSFVGPTTMYALMQAVGMVNDHLEGCWVRSRCMSDLPWPA